ncbi:MAG: glycoside hydrolase [Hymenobacter sp.]|nr:glycoside hydrolase [Hymenobacter sp.]
MNRRLFVRSSLLASAGTLLLPSLGFGLGRSLPRPGAAPVLKLTADAKAKGKILRHYWSECVGAGRANEGLRVSWLEQLKLVKEQCGFRYCRFHGLFHDDMFVYREQDGQPRYNWQYVDDLFDRMLALGVRPFVELAFMPKALASTEKTQFWWKANVSPPTDFAKWGALVTAFARHCIARYGLPEVKTWYFEVWNEPDLGSFWNGTKSQYFELYKTSARALKAVDAGLRVGGPATSNFVPDERFDGEVEDKTKHKTLTAKDLNALEWRGVWIKDFLAYCTREQLPVDFVSTHPYPTDWALDPETKKGAGRVREVNATRHDMQWLQATLAASAYPQAEIHLTEWSSSPSPRDPTHDSLQAAAYVVKANLDGIGLAHSLSYWTFTDVFEEGGAGPSIFHGGFGLINYQGIVKPTFHAYRMLHQLGDEMLKREDGLIVTRHSKTGKITALLYHYPAEKTNVVGSMNVTEELNLGTPRAFDLTVTSLRAGAAVQLETLDRSHGFAYAEWEKMGRPEPPTRSQTEALKKAAFALHQESLKADAKGTFTLSRLLAPWTCVLVREADAPTRRPS